MLILSSFYSILRVVLNSRELLKALVLRDIKSRYTGSLFGFAWLIINPIVMLAIYTFVFSVVFNARWGVSGSGSKLEFALVLFAGMMIFNLFSEVVSRAPTIILQNSNLVKKVVFPLEILVVASFGSALFNFISSFFVWLLLYFIVYGNMSVTLFLLPLFILPCMFFVIGVGLLISALGVYLRDLQQVISLLMTVLLFMSPVFYPITALPEEYRHYLYLNPLTYIVEAFRGIVYFNSFSYYDFFLFFITSIFIVSGGYCFFNKARRGFSDVI
ncbi:ABC transporter permease [Aeromonas veronii]|uniref:ABC transporter permease n=1 Tax=Aeromonas veronii TaxID=654 RepID=UPI001D07A922|nr:ABC transporter permease [Aeromonas veronii]